MLRKTLLRVTVSASCAASIWVPLARVVLLLRDHESGRRVLLSVYGKHGDREAARAPPRQLQTPHPIVTEHLRATIVGGPTQRQQLGGFVCACASAGLHINQPHTQRTRVRGQQAAGTTVAASRRPVREAVLSLTTLARRGANTRGGS